MNLFVDQKDLQNLYPVLPFKPITYNYLCQQTITLLKYYQPCYKVEAQQNKRTK